MMFFIKEKENYAKNYFVRVRDLAEVLKMYKGEDCSKKYEIDYIKNKVDKIEQKLSNWEMWIWFTGLIIFISVINLLNHLNVDK